MRISIRRMKSGIRLSTGRCGHPEARGRSRTCGSTCGQTESGASASYRRARSTDGTTDISATAHGWAAGVCTLDPDDPHSPGLLTQYAREYGLKGMRSIPARDGRLDHSGVRALWKTALDEGIVINVLINRDRADHASRLLADFPKLRVVLDHCLNLKVGPEMQPARSRPARFCAGGVLGM